MNGKSDRQIDIKRVEDFKADERRFLQIKEKGKSWEGKKRGKKNKRMR